MVEMVQKHQKLLFSSLTNAVTNTRKNEAWAEITAAINACGVAPRTIKMVKEKFCQKKSEYKGHFAKRKRDAARTGGGPAPEKEDDPLAEAFDAMFGTDPSWDGVKGGKESQIVAVEDEAERIYDPLLSNLFEDSYEPQPSSSFAGEYGLIFFSICEWNFQMQRD